MRGYVSKRYTALKYPDFRLYLLGQVISMTGSQMQIVALNWHIYILTNSAAALGLIGLVRFIPILIFSAFGGVAADSYNRKKIMFVSTSFMTLFAAVLAFITLNNTVNAFWIYTLTVLAAGAAAFDMPARQAFVPSLVKKEHLANAMSINTIMWQIATIVGPALGGFVIAKYGTGVAYAFNAASYIAILIGLLFIKSDGHTGKTMGKMSLFAIVDGFRFVRRRTILWSTMILDFFSTFFASATSLIPIFAKDILAVGPQGVGLLYAAPSVGAVIAGFTMAHLGTIRKQGKVLLAGVAFYALGTIFFGLSTIFALSFGALMMIGAGDSVSAILRQTIRQLETTDEMRGRMSAINMMFVMGGPQLGEFEAGLLAAAIGGPFSVVVGGVGTLVAVAIVAKYIPSLAKYDGHHGETPIG